MSPASGYVRGGRAVSGIWRAFKQLNPANLQAESGRRIRLGVVGSVDLLQEVATRLLNGTPEAFDAASESLFLVTTPLEPSAFYVLPKCDAVLLSSEHKETLPGVATDRIFELKSADDLPAAVQRILNHPKLAYAHLPLARAFPAFRHDVALRTIQTISVENAIFVASTSLGNVIPNPLQPLASVAEGLGDLVVLTANQLRMLFAVGAAYGKPIGFRMQAAEVGSIIAAAFGWRSIARELAGKIPLGGGVVPKAAIAFGATWAIGDGLVYYYATGTKLTRKELRDRFETAYAKGREVAERIASQVKDGIGRTFPPRSG